MSKVTIQVDEQFLQKIAQYISLMNQELRQQRSHIKEAFQKEASVKQKQYDYEAELRKTAKVLYDTDFITDEFEKKEFLSKAASDPSYIAKVLQRVCNASDVAGLGKVASVRIPPKVNSNHDPVYARAFGRQLNQHIGNVIDLE